MSAAPPRTRQRTPGQRGEPVDLDQRRLRRLEGALDEVRSELAVMEARWFHMMAEMRRLQRRLEVGSRELVLLRERLTHTRPDLAAGKPATTPQGRARRWWERWP